MPLARVKQKGQVTIPVSIREEMGIDEGDYVEITRENDRIVLTPKAVVDRHPAPAPRDRRSRGDPKIDAALAKGLADVRAGRVSPSFKNMKEFEAWLNTDEGKKFGKE